MKPKLRVWRLQYEKRHVKGRKVRVLALRDQDDKLKRVARTRKEQEELEKWWQDYNSKLKFEELPVSKKLRKEFATVRRWLVRKGLVHWHLCCGTTGSRVTRKTEYKYLITFKASRWNAIEAMRIETFFRNHIPETNLGVFVYHNKKLYEYFPESSPARRRLRLSRDHAPSHVT